VGGEFFASPEDPTQRRYEALRAYLFEGRTAAEVAGAFGYTVQTLNSMVRDFRAGRREFFVSSRPGPKRAPGKERAHDRIVELRAAGHSIDEIALVLKREAIGLNRTGIAEVIAEEGFERLWRRPEALRGAPRRESLPRTGVIDFETWPERVETKHAGLLLCIPDLVALDLPGIVAAAGYPGTTVIPAVSSILSLLALKLANVRRVSHVEDIATDHGAALFAGLSSLPKTTALASYSYKLSHERQQAFLRALDSAMVKAGLIVGDDFDLDFHAIMHWGEDPALEKHYVPRRSQRTRAVLTFFAQDADTHQLAYANADLSKAEQAREVGRAVPDPARLVRFRGTPGHLVQRAHGVTCPPSGCTGQQDFTGQVRHPGFTFAWNNGPAMPAATVSTSSLAHSGSGSSGSAPCGCTRTRADRLALPTWTSSAPPGSIRPYRSNAPSSTAS